MKTLERFSPSVITFMRNSIEDAHGSEVLFLGSCDESGMVVSVNVRARGDVESVPAVASQMEKGDVIIHNHPSGFLKPSKPDLAIASDLGRLGIGFYIIDNSCDEVYVVIEPVILKENEPLDEGALANYLLPGGGLSKYIPDYETRDSQIDLLNFFTRALNEDLISLAEAGTGVGKSFAYLIPAIKWAEQNQERIVISTATINLQQQLLDKDIPLVKKVLGSNVKVVLVKGRQNYLCKSRLIEALEEGSLFPEEDEQLSSIAEWADTTKTGERTDLAFPANDSIWSRICSEADVCSGIRCSNREGCFILKAKREAAAAQILISNHHLLFADLSMRLRGAGFENTAVLPPFNKIIFDEAHNIENAATSFFAESLNRFAVTKLLNRIQRSRRSRRFGILMQLEKIHADANALEKMQGFISAVKEAIEQLDGGLADLLLSTPNLRLRECDPESRHLVINSIDRFQTSMLRLTEGFNEVLASIPERFQEDAVMFEAKMILRRCEDTASFCEQYKSFEEHSQKVFWLEKNRTASGSTFLQFNITPLDISTLMREAVFEQYSSVLMTSATLTVSDSFRHWKSRVGLAFETERIEEGSFPSPFPYKEHVMVGVPVNAPLPNEISYQEFLSDFVLHCCSVSEGRALVLFTSYAMLTQTYHDVKEKLEKAGIQLFKQGDDDRTKLLNSFKSIPASVLFGTESFWEGVDSPGETLQLVIICRLPFKVPTDPVVKARAELIESRGGNSFFELSLPEAVMKFKQGFGRLMRKNTDRGIVCITDTRVIRKNYGQMFLSSLPETAKSIKPSDMLLEDMESFLYARTD